MYLSQFMERGRDVLSKITLFMTNVTWLVVLKIYDAVTMGAVLLIEKKFNCVLWGGGGVSEQWTVVSGGGVLLVYGPYVIGTVMERGAGARSKSKLNS